jgi:hypothetical protein
MSGMAVQRRRHGSSIEDCAANDPCSPGLWPGVLSTGPRSVLMERKPGKQKEIHLTSFP